MEISNELKARFEKIKEAQKIVDKFYCDAMDIISKTENQYIQDVISATICNGVVNVYYEECCRNCWDRGTTTFPAYWLEDGFDYVADAARLREEEKKEKQLKAQQAKEKAEKEQYEKLKRKFENNLTDEELKEIEERERKEKEIYEKLKQKFEKSE